MLQDDLDFIRSDFYPLKVYFYEGVYLIMDKNILIEKITEQTWKYACKESRKLIIKDILDRNKGNKIK